MFAIVHDLDPVVFSLTSAIKLRWYGLSYLMGFVAGLYLLRFLTRRGLWCVEEAKISDFMAMLAIFGVFLGGRLGYILFYMIPEDGWGKIMKDPMALLRVWDGGMASHGGLLGVMTFTLYYAWKNKVSWTAIGDGICVVAPLGLMFGRLANFINGELYGRVAHGVAWARQFPQSLHHESEDVYYAVQDELFQRAPDYLGTMKNAEEFSAAVRESDVVKDIVGRHFSERHPSQLYEAFGEGALLFALMWFLRMRFPKAPHGMITGVFFITYAVVRMSVEQFREPDAKLIWGMTKGQFYSSFMILIGIGFLVVAMLSGKKKSDA